LHFKIEKDFNAQFVEELDMYINLL